MTAQYYELIRTDAIDVENGVLPWDVAYHIAHPTAATSAIAMRHPQTINEFSESYMVDRDASAYNYILFATAATMANPIAFHIETFSVEADGTKLFFKFDAWVNARLTLGVNGFTIKNAVFSNGFYPHDNGVFIPRIKSTAHAINNIKPIGGETSGSGIVLSVSIRDVDTHGVSSCHFHAMLYRRFTESDASKYRNVNTIIETIGHITQAKYIGQATGSVIARAWQIESVDSAYIIPSPFIDGWGSTPAVSLYSDFTPSSMEGTLIASGYTLQTNARADAIGFSVPSGIRKRRIGSPLAFVDVQCKPYQQTGEIRFYADAFSGLLRLSVVMGDNETDITAGVKLADALSATSQSIFSDQQTGYRTLQGLLSLAGTTTAGVAAISSGNLAIGIPLLASAGVSAASTLTQYKQDHDKNDAVNACGRGSSPLLNIWYVYDATLGYCPIYGVGSWDFDAIGTAIESEFDVNGWTYDGGAFYDDVGLNAGQLSLAKTAFFTRGHLPLKMVSGSVRANIPESWCRAIGNILKSGVVIEYD